MWDFLQIGGGVLGSTEIARLISVLRDRVTG